MRLHHSLKHALDGISCAFKEHTNMRIHLAAGVAVLVSGLYIGLSSLETLILVFTIALVLITEMINTAIESMTDLITKQYHKEAKIAKDVSAGMVLLTATFAVIIGLVIFLPHLVNALN